MNIAIIGSSSEIAQQFVRHVNTEEVNTYFVTSNKYHSNENTKTLVIKDYLDEKNTISDYIKDLECSIVIFFNGYLAENRPIRFPTEKEINTTFKINYLIPIELTKLINKESKKVPKFIYISSMAAVRPRFKNYIYGLCKSNLEKSIIDLELSEYLIIRFGKVKTKMSKNHKNPPSTISAEKAGRIISNKLEDNGLVYANFNLFIISKIIKLLPKKIIEIIGL
jgi:short-subunit dehydrogenase